MSSQVDGAFTPFTIPFRITIEDLPLEVLIHILSFISLQDLLQNINRVSKRFYFTINTTPKLWSEVHFDNPVQITKASLETLCKYSKTISSLLLPCSIYDIDVPEVDWYLSSCSFASLQWLNLSEASLSTLCFLYSAPKLTIIDLSGCSLLLDEDFYVLKSCASLEQIYVSFTNVSQSTLTAICKDKSLVVLDACDVAVDGIHCKRILDNTQGHLVHMTVSFQGSKLEFDSEIGNVYQNTTMRVYKYV